MVFLSFFLFVLVVVVVKHFPKTEKYISILKGQSEMDDRAFKRRGSFFFFFCAHCPARPGLKLTCPFPGEIYEQLKSVPQGTKPEDDDDDSDTEEQQDLAESDDFFLAGAAQVAHQGEQRLLT